MVVVVLASACGAPVSGLRPVAEDPTENPLPGITVEERERFERGDPLFERVFLPTQGLGPVFVRAACASCHADDAKGPGLVQRVVRVEADGITPMDDARQLELLPWGSALRPQFTAGATRGVTLPSPADRSLLVTQRFGPAVFGRGFLEAVSEDEVERVARAQASSAGPERGVVPRLADGRLGRFGVKSRVATLREFTADAFRGDMGLTSSLFPDEVPNPDGLRDDLRPGVDLPDETIDDVAAYVRLLAIPRREGLTDAGSAAFARARCATCHVPSLRTQRDFSVAALADVDASIYTDILLHDMGSDLADGVREGGAGPRQWRTAPLIGLRHLRNYMHDGRARSLAEAVERHRGEGSEANAAVGAFRALGPAEREALLGFLARL